MKTVFDVFIRAVKKWPDRPMFQVLPETASVYGISAGEISYQDASNRVSELADEYKRAGYLKGHRVLLLLENRPSYFLHWLALNSLGCSVVPVNPDLRAAEIAYLISHSEPTAAVSLEGRQADLSAVGTVFGSDGPILPPTAEPNAMPNEAAMLYTSGTTGNPKGCILTHEYFTMSGEWYRTTGGLCAISEDYERMITPLPTFHMNAMACSFMAMITVGGCLIALDRFHPSTWWHSVRESRATCLHYLGVMPSMLMNAASSGDDTSHSVRFGFGAGIDPKLHAPFEERFNIPLVEAWAMTETGCANAIVANQHPRLVGKSCLGAPSNMIEVKIVNEEGKDVPSNTPGELLIKRAGSDPKRGFFDHYYKNPEATHEAWDSGWFNTGDLVQQDAHGRIFFVDRKKNVIRRSGENIAAVEVESILMRHPQIEAAGVAAVPDPMRGDEVFACLKVVGDAKAEDIAKWGLEQMAYYKVPGYIAFVDQLPLTSTHKIQRAELKKVAQDLLINPKTVSVTHLKKRQIA